MFIYSSFEKSLEKQTKTTEDKGRKQLEAWKALQSTIKDGILEGQLNEELQNKIEKIKEMKKW